MDRCDFLSSGFLEKGRGKHKRLKWGSCVDINIQGVIDPFMKTNGVMFVSFYFWTTNVSSYTHVLLTFTNLTSSIKSLFVPLLLTL